MMQSNQIIASLYSFEPVQKMTQSGQIILSLFSNRFEPVQKMMQGKKNYCITFFSAYRTLKFLGWSGLGWPVLAWPWLGWPGLDNFQKFLKVIRPSLASLVVKNGS
jgi:hypothetical protein